MKPDPLCNVPYIYSSIGADGRYRDCCATSPNIRKFEADFTSWWTGPEMTQLRDSLHSDQLPQSCRRCKYEEDVGGISFRTTNLKDYPIVDYTMKYPMQYQIGFSSLCNLACWSCSELYSSRIADDKIKLGLLPVTFLSEVDKFQLAWPSLKASILESYSHHEIVHINIFGGEPTINTDVIEFLTELNDRNLTERTRLEFFTNCQTLQEKFVQAIATKKWNYLIVLASIDAYGTKNEWVRYGSTWKNVDKNLRKLATIANYTKIMAVMSTLTVGASQRLKEYAKEVGVDIGFQYATTPAFLDLQSWDGDKFIKNSSDPECQLMINSLGSNPVQGTKKALREYIERFAAVRPLSLESLDKTLYDAIFKD